ncbi:hypothetical protein GQR58_001116 [Nymphon striatum]|nr:hypothetical protein GQR58_001116 [Nymphon striatum]
MAESDSVKDVEKQHEHVSISPQPDSLLSAVSIKLPPYWPKDPSIWFRQLEAQFRLRGISSQRTCFDYAVSALSPDVISEFILVLNDPEFFCTKMATKMSDEANQRKVLNSLMLGEDELCEFFSDYFPKLRITMQDLKIPKVDKIKSMYEAFLFDFGISLNHLPQSLMMVDANEITDDDQAVYICNFFTIMENLLSSIGFNDLLIRDLTDPKPKRTRLILSFLKNYWEYIYHRYGNYITFKESLVKDGESLREHCAKIEIVKKKINNIRLRDAEKEPLVKQAKLKFESAELQRKDEELLKKIPSENDTKSFEEMSQKEVKANETKEEKKSKVIETKKLAERIKKMKSELNSALVVLQTRQQDLNKYKELELQLESHHKMLNDENENKNTQFNELKRHKRLLVIKEESLVKLRIQQSRKLNAATDTIEQLKKDLSKLQQQQGQCSDVENQQMNTLKEIEKKIKEAENAFEEMKNQLQMSYSKLLKKIDEWHSKVLEDLEKKNELMLET